MTPTEARLVPTYVGPRPPQTAEQQARFEAYRQAMIVLNPVVVSLGPPPTDAAPPRPPPVSLQYRVRNFFLGGEGAPVPPVVFWGVLFIGAYGVYWTFRKVTGKR